jgi:hypothetical protein
LTRPVDNRKRERSMITYYCVFNFQIHSKIYMCLFTNKHHIVNWIPQVFRQFFLGL